MTVSPLLSRPGAVAVEGGSVAAHYGDPLREQRLLAEGAGLVDRSDRDVLTIPGADRLSWLHSLTSQHLDRLADGTGTEALVLSPHGHVEHHLVLADLGGVTWADVEPGTGAGLQTFLERMRFMMRVDPQLGTDRWAVLSVIGPRAAEVLAAATLPVPDAVAALDGGGWIRRMPPIGDGGAQVYDLLVPRTELDTTADRILGAGASLAGIDAFEALRVEARRPRFGVDSDHRTIPNELPWLTTAVHLDKGCYGGRRPSPACTTSAGHRGGWSCCTWTASARCCPSRGRPCWPARARWAGSAPWSVTTSSASSPWRWSSSRSPWTPRSPWADPPRRSIPTTSPPRPTTP